MKVKKVELEKKEDEVKSNTKPLESDTGKTSLTMATRQSRRGRRCTYPDSLGLEL